MDPGHERKQKEKHAVKLMLYGKKNPKAAMEISECNYSVGSKNYKRVYKRVYRKRKLL